MLAGVGERDTAEGSLYGKGSRGDGIPEGRCNPWIGSGNMDQSSDAGTDVNARSASPSVVAGSTFPQVACTFGHTECGGWDAQQRQTEVLSCPGTT